MSEKVPEKLEVPPVEAASTSKSTASGAESPRTGRDPDFDDDATESQLPAPERQPTPSKGPKRVSFQDQEDEAPAPPPKPLRAVSPRVQAEATLVEAFPTMDVKVIRAVLIASGGRVEPAFNALLGMSDPDYVQDLPPPPPPRKAHTMSQVEADALYARQLAQHYSSSTAGFGSREQGDPPLPTRRRETGLKPNELYEDREHSFMDDDLPVIKQNLAKGFQDTKNTINKWLKDFQRRLDGDDSDEPIPRPGGSQPQRQDFGPSTSNQLQGIRKSAEANRRSGDKDRYDADPQVLGDDFGHRLELRDDETPPPKPPRPLANPDLFKSTAPSTTPTGDIASAEGLSASTGATANRQAPAAGATAKSGKWQPLASVDPTPMEDHDPFSLGDSDEEPEGKKAEAKATEAASGKDASESSAKAKVVETSAATKTSDSK